MSEHSPEHREKIGRTERPHHVYHKKSLMDAVPRENRSLKPETRLSAHQGAPVEQTAINALSNMAKNEVPPSPSAAIAEAALAPEAPATIIAAYAAPEIPEQEVSEPPLIPKIQNYDDVDLDQLVTAAVESRDNPEPPAPVTPAVASPEAVEVPVPDVVFEEPVEPTTTITAPVFIETAAPAAQAKKAEPEAPAPVEIMPPAHAIGDPAELNGEKVFIEEQLTAVGGKVAYEVSKEIDDSRVLAYETTLTFLDPVKEKAHEANHAKELWDTNSGLIKEKFQFEHLGERWTDPGDKTINRGVDPNATFEEQEPMRVHNRTVFIMGSTIVFIAGFLADPELHSTRRLFDVKERYELTA